MANLLAKTRKITSILRRSDERLQDELPYNAITQQLAEIMDCNACIVNSKGRLWGISCATRRIMTEWKHFIKRKSSQKNMFAQRI